MGFVRYLYCQVESDDNINMKMATADTSCRRYCGFDVSMSGVIYFAASFFPILCIGLMPRSGGVVFPCI